MNYFYDHFPVRKVFVYQMIFHDMFPGFSHDHPYEITVIIPMIIPLITISRSILHGYKLILNSLLVLMGISTFTSKEFSFLQGISHYIPIKIILNHHYYTIIPSLSHDYPMIIPLITMYLWSISHYIPIKILLNDNKSPVNRSLWGVDRLDSAERAALAASVASAQKEAEEAVPWRRFFGGPEENHGKMEV